LIPKASSSKVVIDINTSFSFILGHDQDETAYRKPLIRISSNLCVCYEIIEHFSISCTVDTVLQNVIILEQSTYCVLLHGRTFYMCVDFQATNRCTEKVTHIYTITYNGEAKSNLFILYSRCCLARGYTRVVRCMKVHRCINCFVFTWLM
jgi:hypothetical protein